MKRRTDLTIWEQFDKFHEANPHVYVAMLAFANELRAVGRNKSSVWLIGNRLRWETAISTTGANYTLPNETFSRYARLIMHEHKEFRGFFTLKPLRHDRERQWWEWPSSVARLAPYITEEDNDDEP
jgi:hypothetical protein